MANPQKGEALVTLSDGRELTLAMSFDELCIAERMSERHISEMLREIAEGMMHLDTFRAFVYAALRKHHSDIQFSEVGPLIISDGAALRAALEEAMMGAFPSVQTNGSESDARPQTRRGGIGSPSSASGPPLASSPRNSGSKRPPRTKRSCAPVSRQTAST